MRPTRMTRAAYAHFETYPTRWRDNDVYGHMNNAVYYEYVDSVVNGWLIARRALDVPEGPVIALVVETACVFHAALGFPDPVEAGLRAARIGSSSVTYGIGLFRPGEPEEAAQARLTHVCVDRSTRRPVPLPDGLRAALARISV